MVKLPFYRNLFVFSFFLSSCVKDVSRRDFNNIWLLRDQVTAKANFQGFVFDESNLPVIGASIEAGGISTTTNEQGIFFIDQAIVSENNAVVTISKPGYFTCVKSLRITPEDDNVVNVQLVERKLSGTMTTQSGGTTSLPSGTSVSIPANGVVDAKSGQAYTGRINVFMHWLDPSKIETLYQMPGELRGVNNTGEERMLVTYGMTTVELEGEGGQKLQLAPKAEAKLIFEVPASMEAEAPKTIPLWYYDETKGRWFEEGVAKLANGKYEGMVAHFSTWNCDAPYEKPMIRFCIKIKDENNVPFANAHVLLRRANDKWGGHGYTNGKGILCGLIPASTPLILDILGEPGCEQTVLSKPIGSYKEEVEMDSVVVRRDPEKMITVSGIVMDCTGKLVKDGYVQGKISYRASIAKVTNGKFQFNVVRCPADNELTLFAIDNASKKVTDRITRKISGNKENVGTITACTDASKLIFNGLAAYFPFDGNANDESGNENHLTASGVTFNNDAQRGKVAAFDGKGWMERTSGLFPSLSGLTFSFWAKSSTKTVMDVMGQSCGNDCVDDIRVQFNGPQCGIAGLTFKSPAFFATAPANTSDGKWHFYTLVMGESNFSYGNFKFYIDGEMVGITCGHNWGGWTYSINQNYNFIISGVGPLGNRFSGELDDVRVFKRALTELEVKTLSGI